MQLLIIVTSAKQYFFVDVDNHLLFERFCRDDSNILSITCNYGKKGCFFRQNKKF